MDNEQTPDQTTTAPGLNQSSATRAKAARIQGEATMTSPDLVVIRPGMLFHGTDGPKWIIDTMNFGYDPEVHGRANCLHADAASAIELLKGNGISAVATIYVYATWDDWVRIRDACPTRNLKRLTF